MNPWNPTAAACVPMWPAPPSLKIHQYAKAVMALGTVGVGFVCCNLQPGNDASGTSYPVIHSTNAYTSNKVDTNTALTGVTGVNHNGPYPEASFAGGITSLKVRPVSMGLRIRYIGSEDERGGYIYGVVSPLHATTDDVDTADMRLFDRSQAHPVTREWTTLTWFPVTTAEVNYYQDSGDADLLSHSMAFIVVGTAGHQFAFEYALNDEVIGQGARGKTANVTATGAAQDVISKLSSETQTTLTKMSQAASAGS